eukprot:Awhi_evm1s5055
MGLHCEKVNFVCLPYKDNCFQVTAALNVLEYVSDTPKVKKDELATQTLIEAIRVSSVGVVFK